jgi:hypothetical protein
MNSRTPPSVDDRPASDTTYKVGDLVRTRGSYVAYYFSLGGLMTQTVTIGDRYDKKLWVDQVGIIQEKAIVFSRLISDHEEYLSVYFPHTRETLMIRQESLDLYRCVRVEENA